MATNNKLFTVLQTSFNNFDNSVKQYLTKTLGALGIDYGPTQIFSVIYSGIKGVLQNVMFYIEDALVEQNIQTANRKKSFYSLARQSGYDPYYGSASTGIINCTTSITSLNNGSISSKIYIKDGTQLINNNTSKIYTIILSTEEYVIDLAKSLKTHQFKVVQGTYSSAWFTATGENFENFSITVDNLYDKEYTKVFVNEEEFTQFASLYDMTSSDNGYMIITGFDSTFTIIFGNGVHGSKLSEGDSVEVKYLAHDGEDGNILITDIVDFKFIDNVYDSNGNVLSGDDYLTLALDSTMSGGVDSDSISLVRQMIGYNSRSLVLATDDSIRMFLKRYSFVGNAYIFTNPNSLRVTICCLSNNLTSIDDPEDYLSLDESDFLLTNNQKTLLEDALNNSMKTFAGLTFTISDPIISKFSIVCYVKISSSYLKDTIKSLINNTISTYFLELPENTSFIAKSDIIKVVLDSSDEIEAFDFDFISDDNEKAYKNGYYNIYKITEINGEQKLKAYKTLYNSSETINLDDYGNISLNSDLQLPLLHGNFNYYPNKSTNDKTTTIRTNAIDIHFI